MGEPIEGYTATEADPWDWPVLLYIAKTKLLYSEAEFWAMTPRKFYALLDAHLQMLGGEKKQQRGFIDSVL